jgi:MFS family permease
MRAESHLRLIASRTIPGPERSQTTSVPTAIGRTPFAWLSADLGRVLASASAWGFGFSTFYLLPKFLAQELHAGPFDIGMVVGIFSVATVLATPLAGWVVDRFPRRYAMVVGAVLMALSALGFVGVRGLGYWLDVLRLVQGISYALVVTAVGTLVADVVPRERLNQALGLSGASMLIMNALAPAIAEPLAVVAGWPAVFALAAGVSGCAAGIAMGIREPQWARLHAGAGGMLALLSQPLARHYAVVVALIGTTFGAVFTFEPAYALALGRSRVGGFFVAYALAAIVVRIVFGGVPARLGSYRVARGSLGLYAAVVFALPFTSAAMLDCMGGLYGMAHGLFFPAINAIAITAVRPHERGRMVAIFTGAFALGLAGGSTLLGGVAELAGYGAVFAIAGIGTVAAAIVLIASPALRAAGRALEPGV